LAVECAAVLQWINTSALNWPGDFTVEPSNPIDVGFVATEVGVAARIKIKKEPERARKSQNHKLK
jgi:hypothetical protein